MKVISDISTEGQSMLTNVNIGMTIIVILHHSLVKTLKLIMKFQYNNILSLVSQYISLCCI